MFGSLYTLTIVLLVAKVEGEVVGCPVALLVDEGCSESDESDMILCDAVPLPDPLMKVDELTDARGVSVLPLLSVVAAGV